MFSYIKQNIISFSDEIVMQNARDAFAKAYDKELKEKIKIWMK